MAFMIPTIVRNFLGRRATLRYPLEKRPITEGVRGHLEIDKEICDLCVRCSMVCPTHCLTVDRKTGHWEFDVFACVNCGVCVENCKRGALKVHVEHRPPSREHPVVAFDKEVPQKKKKEAAPEPEAALDGKTTCEI